MEKTNITEVVRNAQGTKSSITKVINSREEVIQRMRDAETRRKAQFVAAMTANSSNQKKTHGMGRIYPIFW